MRANEASRELNPFHCGKAFKMQRTISIWFFKALLEIASFKTVKLRRTRTDICRNSLFDWKDHIKLFR